MWGLTIKIFRLELPDIKGNAGWSWSQLLGALKELDSLDWAKNTIWCSKNSTFRKNFGALASMSLKLDSILVKFEWFILSDPHAHC